MLDLFRCYLSPTYRDYKKNRDKSRKWHPSNGRRIRGVFFCFRCFCAFVTPADARCAAPPTLYAFRSIGGPQDPARRRICTARCADVVAFVFFECVHGARRAIPNEGYVVVLACGQEVTFDAHTLVCVRQTRSLVCPCAFVFSTAAFGVACNT